MFKDGIVLFFIVLYGILMFVCSIPVGLFKKIFRIGGK